jgi:hypothetical protein
MYSLRSSIVGLTCFSAAYLGFVCFALAQNNMASLAIECAVIAEATARESCWRTQPGFDCTKLKDVDEQLNCQIYWVTFSPTFGAPEGAGSPGNYPGTIIPIPTTPGGVITHIPKEWLEQFQSPDGVIPFPQSEPGEIYG